LVQSLPFDAGPQVKGKIVLYIGLFMITPFTIPFLAAGRSINKNGLSANSMW